MAKNLYQKEGKYLSVVLAAITSGDPVVKGALHGVATASTDTAGKIPLDTGPSAYNLSVKGIDDNGNMAVAFGDALFYVAADTPKLSKKASGSFFGYALGAVNAAATLTIPVLVQPGVGGFAIPADSIKQTMLDRDYIFEEFESNPLTAKLAGGASAGATGTTNIMHFEENSFEYHIKGTQTILAPSVAADGLDVGMDQTDDDGVEISNGITARSRAALVVGTAPAFFARARIKIPDVSGTDDCAFGFRKAEAYQANIDDYDEMAALNVTSGDIKIETILNNGATTTTDTTDNFADDGEHTLEVYVSAAGAVTYKIDGAAPTATAAFSFDAGEVVVPFFFMLNSADLAGSVLLESWEVGLQ